MARSNVLMFRDWNWVKRRDLHQARALATWHEGARHPVVIELGAGTDIPSALAICERQSRPLIRVNPREPGRAGREGISLPMGALQAMRGIREALARR